MTMVFALDETWDLSYRLAGGYEFTKGILLSTLYQAYNGLPRQRTNIFRAANPPGGPAFPSSSIITMRMEPFGELRGSARNIANLRIAKEIALGKQRRVTGSVDLQCVQFERSVGGRQMVV